MSLQNKVTVSVADFVLVVDMNRQLLISKLEQILPANHKTLSCAYSWRHITNKSVLVANTSNAEDPLAEADGCAQVS